jgi:4-hydroxy-tetrahydrodipicolinate reductase
MRLAFFGRDGKVGRALIPVLERAGHEVLGIEVDEPVEIAGFDAAVDFTMPAAAARNARTALEQGVHCVVGTTGWDPTPLDALARERGRVLFVAPNFSIGAVLMMRLTAQAAAYLPRVEIIELHNEAKKDAPSGTAKATAALVPGGAAIHSVRLPGLVAHQEVLLAGEGELLTIRHDTLARESFASGVLLVLDRLTELPAGLTVGIDALL